MSEQKAALRSVCLSLRKTLPHREAHITDFAHIKEFAAAKSVFCYVSYGSEIGTHALLEEILSSGKTLLVPKCTDLCGNMCAVQIQALGELSKGEFGIYCPTGGVPFPPESIDVAVMPAAAYEKNGTRLGMGKGFYDRFFAHCSARKIGLVHAELVLDCVFADEWDISADYIVKY